jgi:hypothetical protein
VILLAASALAAGGCGGDDSDRADGAPAANARGGEETSPGAASGSDEGAVGSRREGTGRPDRAESRPEPRDQGSGADDPESRAQAIRRALNGFFTSSDPAIVCEGAVTVRFLREAFGDRRGCVDAQTAGSAARTLEIKRTDGTADSVTAVAVPAGGPNGGERLEIDLVRDGRDWRIDGIRSDVPVGP